MSPPRCHNCRRPMRVIGLLPVDEGGRQRVFQVWACQAGDCGQGQATIEAGQVKRDEWERRRDE